MTQSSRADSSPTSLILQARYASALLHPLRFLHSDHMPDLGLEQQDVQVLSGQPQFAKAINTHTSQKLGLLQIDSASTASASLSQDVQCRLAVLLATLPAEEFSVALRFTAIARAQKFIGSVLMKRQRQQLEALLGEDAFDLAVRDLAFFHAILAYVADEDDVLPNLLSTEEPEAYQALTLVGAEGILAFVLSVDEALAPLIRLRFSQEVNTQLDQRVQVMNPEQRDHYRQFLHRRIPEWQAFIS